MPALAYLNSLAKSSTHVFTCNLSITNCIRRVRERTAGTVSNGTVKRAHCRDSEQRYCKDGQ